MSSQVRFHLISIEALKRSHFRPPHQHQVNSNIYTESTSSSIPTMKSIQFRLPHKKRSQVRCSRSSQVISGQHTKTKSISTNRTKTTSIDNHNRNKSFWPAQKKKINFDPHAKAISYGRALRNENERFLAAQSIINLMDPKLVICSAKFCSFHFRDDLKPKIGPPFRSTSAIETGVWIWVSTHRGRQQALRYTEISSSNKATSICQASNKTCAAFCILLSTPARVRYHHELLGRRCCDRRQWE